MVNFNPILVKEGMYNGRKVTMKFAKAEGRIQADFLQNINGAEIGCGYNLKDNSENKKTIMEKVKKFCAQTKEGFNLFKEIMSCIK